MNEITKAIFKRRDAILALLVFVVASWWGSAYVASRYGDADYYQSEFGPAVLAACGLGFANPSEKVQSSLAPLREYLHAPKRKPSFSCAELPAKVETGPLTHFQIYERYLLGSAAVIWKLFGVSWSNLTLLMIGQYATAITLAFLIFRLAAPVGLSLIATVWLLSSDFFASFALCLRDFSKTPFAYFLFFTCGLVVTKGLRGRRLMFVACLCGLALGVSLGFRIDLLIFAPFVILTLFFFSGGRFKSEFIRRLSACAAFVASLFAGGWPILVNLQRGTNLYHVALLGLMKPTDIDLNIQSGLYEFGHFYSDEYAVKLVEEYAQRTAHVAERLHLATPMYDVYSRSLYLEYIRNFPADVLVRAFAAAVGVTKQVIDDVRMPALFGRESVAASLYAFKASMVSVAAPVLVLMAMLGICAFVVTRRPKLGLFLGIWIVFLFTYPVIQYAWRHTFYLLFVPPLFLIGTLQFAFARMAKLRGSLASLRHISPLAWRRYARSGGILCGVFIGGFGLCLAVYSLARSRQAAAVSRLAAEFRSRPTVVVSAAALSRSNGETLFSLPEVSHLASSSEAIGGLAVLVEVLPCRAASSLTLGLKFVSAAGEGDSWRFKVKVESTPLQVALPVEFMTEAQSVNLIASDPGCVGTVSGVTHLDGLPLLFASVLPSSEHPARDYYQKMAF